MNQKKNPKGTTVLSSESKAHIRTVLFHHRHDSGRSCLLWSRLLPVASHVVFKGTGYNQLEYSIIYPSCFDRFSNDLLLGHGQPCNYEAFKVCIVGVLSVLDSKVRSTCDLPNTQLAFVVGEKAVTLLSRAACLFSVVSNSAPVN